MAFTIRQLQFFVAVAEAGTVSHAAQALSISQSSVTEAIKELEADLNVKLFERHPRGLSITHTGHQFLRHATRILTDISDARRSFSEQASNRGGRLQLGVTSLVAGYVLSDLLARYRRAFPSVEVHAIEDNGDYLEHLLIGGELDVAVMVVSNLRDRLAIDAEIVEVSPYRLWLPLGHPLASADSIALADILSEPLIMLTIDEVEENTGKLLAAFGSPPQGCFPHAIRRGGAQPGRHRRRTRTAARPRLPALVSGRRSHRVARRLRLTAGGSNRHDVAARVRSHAKRARFHRHSAGPARRTAAAMTARYRKKRNRPPDK